VEETHVKHAVVTTTCAVALVASLSGCGGSASDKPPLPGRTGASGPSATPPDQPTTTSPTAGGTSPGQAALAAHSTYKYGDLVVVVNLPPDIPARARPGVQLFSDFLQGVSRTTAENKLDPSLAAMASADVVRYVRTFVEAGSARGVGSVVFTVDKVQASNSGIGVIAGCLDQSQLVQVGRDGARFVDAKTKKYPTLTMTADINAGPRKHQVSHFAYAVGTCS
jgi:hypothetical protein